MMIEESLSYDDVLLLPGYADFLPGEADVRSRLVGDIYLNIPIISSAMDTVTGVSIIQFKKRFTAATCSA